MQTNVLFAVVTCEALSLEHGAVSYNQVMVGNRYPVDPVVTFTCNSGYSRDGCERTSCQTSGNLAHAKPKCNKGEKL